MRSRRPQSIRMHEGLSPNVRAPDLVRENMRIEEIGMIPDSAAERRQNVATAGVVAISQPISRGAAKDSAAAPRLMRVQNGSTAFSRGYILTPLRGRNRIIQNLHSQMFPPLL